MKTESNSPQQPAAAAQHKRLVVLISGTGTLMQALIEACQDPAYGATVVGVVADRDGIDGLAKAAAANIPTAVCRVSDYPVRDAFDDALSDTIASFRPDLVISAGFMKILGRHCLSAFADKMINTHPALCPAFPGVRGPADALEYGVRVTGATLFFVQAGVDDGPVIDQRPVLVNPDDTVATLHERIKVVEREMLVDNVGRMMRHGWSIRGRHVTVHG